MPMIVQIGKNGSSWVEQSSAWRSRMETHHLYVVACWCYSCACKYVELGLYWDSPWTAVWIWYVMFFSFGNLYQILLIMCLHRSVSWSQHACNCIISHTRVCALARERMQMLQNGDWKYLIPWIIIVSTTSSFYYTHLYGFYHFIITRMHRNMYFEI